VDAKNANAARTAAEEAQKAAKGANLAADAADQASKAADAAGDAAHSAASAGVNANAAANAAIEAGNYAGQSSAAAAEARAAAAATKRHAAEANRAAAEAEALARKAATAAREARDAARSAATHAKNASDAALDAAEHAGQAGQAATKSTEHANAATAAANVATAAVVKAQDIYTLAREIESAELVSRTNQAIELARDDKASEAARTTTLAEQEKGAKDRDTERDRLVAEAAKPVADLTAVADQGRDLAVLVMKNGSAWGRAASEAALGGPDEVVVDYLRNGWSSAKQQDERSYVERLAEESDDKAVRDAAETALDGDAATITAFVDNGQYQAAGEGMRIAIAQVLSDAGPVLTEVGRTALATGNPKKFSEFLVKTQHSARTQDERIRAAQAVDSGSPEVKAAARIALEGSPQALHAFIVSGQYKAQRKDHLAAIHVAQVRKLISDAAKIAATAQQNAATAQKVAATARKAAAEAKEWAKKADDSATKAQDYAKQADQYAKDAEASAAKAAASAETAREAANRADASASRAAKSAADATLSSESAQASASNAAYYADEARKSAVAAGKDAEAALKAATETFTIAVTKYREEEEARRKAAVAAKEKAKNDGAPDAAELYRCQQALVPCDPVGFARWCQQSDIYCALVRHGKEFGDAMESLWNTEKDLLGLGEFEKCLQNKDLEHCKSVAVDALLSGKLKALDRVYDELKLLKRGCKIVDKAPLWSAASARPASAQTLAARFGGVPCGEHKVPGLPRSTSKIPDSSDCRACAERIRENLGGGEIKVIRPKPPFPGLGRYREQDSFWGEHVVLVFNDRVYDGFTPKAGETIAQYKDKWLYKEDIDFGF